MILEAVPVARLAPLKLADRHESDVTRLRRSPETQGRFICKNPACGFACNADTNAACNIAHETKDRAPQDIVGARTSSPSQ
ncbi:zinc ribbon domain-containing protein [Kitasatospora sp. MAP5-34]|uniref:zinc ribbon domain-containing protein n=1 Tax=Kitasatospora sp. MAP5-34 TaxID=3035102 RepID=UPI0024749147|nr:zinc ribbon domain-containing protein [Kitasatospora sp. MAP5-34]